jgi:hypothetical protein
VTAKLIEIGKGFSLHILVQAKAAQIAEQLIMVSGDYLATMEAYR